jgi:hypothetical protein
MELLYKNGDGGDACNRTCAAALCGIYCGVDVDVSFLKHLQNFIQPWLWRRAPDAGKWYADWDRFSRDQAIPLIILMGEKKLYKHLAWFIFGHIQRGMLFMTNTRRNHVYMKYEDHVKYSTPDVEWDPKWKLPDITGPEFWALLIRAMPTPVRLALYPLLVLFDLETLCGAIVRRFFRKDNRDVINHSLILVNGMRRCPTFVMYLATKVTSKSFLKPRLNAFFSQPGEPRIDLLMTVPMNKYL